MSPNRAAAPVPSALPCPPREPARIEATPAGVTLSTVCWLPTYTLPEASIARPCGPPVAGRKVETTPVGVILRIAAFWKSVTKTLPDASTAVVAWPPKLNRTAAPVASTRPKCEGSPASVETTPASVTLRTTKPFSSPT